MKKLATAIAAVTTLAFATPVFACPHEDSKKAADKTAEKKADKVEATDTAKKTEGAKKDTAPKTADTGKVSSK